MAAAVSMGHSPRRPQQLEYMDTAVKVTTSQNSLRGQWLGLSAFTVAARVQSVVRELSCRKPQGVAKKEKNQLKLCGPA